MRLAPRDAHELGSPRSAQSGSATASPRAACPSRAAQEIGACNARRVVGSGPAGSPLVSRVRVLRQHIKAAAFTAASKGELRSKDVTLIVNTMEKK